MLIHVGSDRSRCRASCIVNYMCLVFSDGLFICCAHRKDVEVDAGGTPSLLVLHEVIELFYGALAKPLVQDEAGWETWSRRNFDGVHGKFHLGKFCQCQSMLCMCYSRFTLA